MAAITDDTDTPRTPSLRTVAEAAGVSVATVSHVINGVGRYSEATRKRVERVIEEQGYVANLAARSLRIAKSRSVGMIVPDISNDFFSKIALHTERILAAEGYSVFVCNSGNDANREREYFRTLAGKQVDGIVCISGLRRLDAATLPGRIPLVCIDRAPESERDAPMVGSDNVAASQEAVEHLIRLGRRYIVTVSSFTADYPGNERLIGYRQALAAHGLPLRHDYELYVTGARPSMEEAHDLVRGFLATGKPVDAVFCQSDHAAAGALRALLEAGRRVPGDVALMGFDNSVYSQLTTPPISSVERHPEEMAAAGCGALLALMRGGRVPTRAIVPTELVIRASTR